MIPPVITEHKGDIGIIAAGAGAGALLGNYAYTKTPTKMVRETVVDGVRKNVITNKYIDYAKKVSIKDAYENMDPHVKRTWLEGKLGIIKEQATNAKCIQNSTDRKLLQKTYDLGIKFLTDRQNVPMEDMVLAKRGANAISYGRFAERRASVVKFAAIGGLIALAGKKIVEKYNSLKAEDKSVKDLLPKADSFEKMNWL